MGNVIIDAETAKLAGLQIDFLHKIKNGNINLEEFEKFLNLSQDQRQKMFGAEQEKPTALFSGSIFQKEVIIPERFSLDKNIVPRKEFKYNFVSDYARDEYFAKQIFFGKVTMNIVSTMKKATTKEIAQAANQQDALATISALHQMLMKDEHSLDQFKDRLIIVPVISVAPNAGGGLFCLFLVWDGDDWHWDNDWIDGEWDAGVHVALLSQ